MKRITSILMVLLVITLASSTFIEKFQGSVFVSEHIYHSPFFIALWALIALATIITLIREKAWKRIPVLILHCSFILILTGALLSTLIGKHGSIQLHPGEPASYYQTDNNVKERLPFQITLKEFEIQHYPGTHAPMDFISHVRIAEEQNSYDTYISMNNILKHDHYRFYQSNYDEEGNSVLDVAYDPWGIGVTYAGYILLLIGLISIFFEKNGRFRSLLRNPLLKKGVTATVVLLLLFSSTTFAGTKNRTLPENTAEKMGEMYVLYKGRICPLQTLAKDFTTKLSGKANYKGLSSEQVLSGWMFYFTDWENEPMIKIKGKEVQNILGIEGKYAKFSDFTNEQGENKLAKAMKSLPLGDPLFKKYNAANEKYQIIQMVYNRNLLKIFPHTDSTGNLNWYYTQDNLPLDIDENEYIFIRKQLNYCQELAMKKNFDRLDTVFAKTRNYQTSHAGSVLPSDFRFKAEKCYNRLSTGKWIAMLSITLGLLLFAFYIIRSGNGKNLPKKLLNIGSLYIAVLTLFLLILYILRWIVGGHVPMAGSFDSMTLLSIFIGIICICLRNQTEIAIPAGSLMIGFTQLVAMIGGSNPPVTQLMPVLSSPLLSMHVTVIMIAYALLFFVMLNSLTAIISGGIRKDAQIQMERMRLLSMTLLYPAVALLAIGIFVGAVWANISWGRYWAWDPKEVWALITLLIYAAPLHDNMLKNFQKPWFFHIYNLIAFLSVLITYFGVNLILGGMHSYN